ncbi:hypothetical protein MVEN_00443200 [Mycena venus]|uniref:Uncharacterized protein n=1 Tax=Mycena venus TaxID=2733690 RepID=A0A8H7D8X1_9AGAR|nr:hypothetical protein MVEN_00443200 [Mycena venus]
MVGTGMGISIASDDLDFAEVGRHSIKFLQGIVISVAALKGGIHGAGYNDGLVAWFAAPHPNIAFTHISPGQILTPGSKLYLGWLLSPLAWLLAVLRSFIATLQEECAQYILYALLHVEQGGLFFRNSRDDVASGYVFSPGHVGSLVDDGSPIAKKKGLLNGIPMKGYGGSDATVAGLIAYTERVLADVT